MTGGIPKARLMDGDAMQRVLTRMAHEMMEQLDPMSDVILVGIRRRGEPIARCLAEALTRVEGASVPVGAVDITYYRDDLTHASKDPTINRTEIPFDVNGKTVVLVDDVLYTGRTARAAMEAVMHLGRPRRIQLAVLIDRGHRELPIRADFAGKNIPTAQTEFVRVNMPDLDEDESVWLYDR